MRTRILVMATALLALAGCEDYSNDPITEEMFVGNPAGSTATGAPLGTEDISVSAIGATTPGPDGQPYDPALELVEENPYGAVEERTASGLTERLPDTCKLEDFQQYRGMTAAEISASGLVAPYRMVGPTDIVTQEYNPMRVNFYTDADGRVSRIACG